MSFFSSFVGFGPLPASIVGLVESGPLLGVLGTVGSCCLTSALSAVFSLPIVIVLESLELPQPANSAAAARSERAAGTAARRDRLAPERGVGASVVSFTVAQPTGTPGGRVPLGRRMPPAGLVRPQARGRGTVVALGSATDRARRGGSGALHPQSALAGLNSPPRDLAPVAPQSKGRRWSGSRAVSAREPG